MANKYERRRRTLKDTPSRRENPNTWPRASSATSRKAGPQPLNDGGRRASRGVAIAICCMLVLGAAIIYVQTERHGFVNCDDDEYVEKNIHVQRGLTPASASWAMTQAHSANWHPLTWMSHMIDWQIFGTWDADLQRYVNSWPGGHHMVNLILHACCAVLLFLILQEMTGATWPSAAVAALFAVHPLRVESVAWATGRKDTLSALFFLLTLAAYHSYATRRFSFWRYGLVIGSFALGLMAKSMLVTMPFVLLLLDFWPLRRIAPPYSGDFWDFLSRLLPLRVILEKIPMLALSVASCMLTVWAQSLVAAFKPLDFQFREINALLSYAAYIGQMFYPVGMVVQYVHRGPHLQWHDADTAIAVLVPITLAVVGLGWRWRYLAVGWFWYLGMLVPVIGLVQVGAQARADRYTYLTQIGLYIMIVWGLRDLARAWRGRTALYAVLAVPIFAVLSIAAWIQTSYWQNSVTMWGHCVDCQPANDFAQNSYGQALTTAGQIDEANAHFIKSVETNPKYHSPWINYAVNLHKQGKSAEALTVCENALKQVDPESSDIDQVYSQIHALKAVLLFTLNQPEEAIREFGIAIEKNPRNFEAHGNLAEVLRRNGRIDEALVECRAALELSPEMPAAHQTMGNILLAKNDLEGAIEQFQVASKLKPNDASIQQGLADVLWRQGKFQEAVEHRKQQLALQPRNLPMALKVARELLADSRPEARFGADALQIARTVCEATGYQDVFALDVLAATYAEMGDFDQAEATIRKAMETPEGHTKNNPEELQKRLLMYHAHQKVPIRPPSP